MLILLVPHEFDSPRQEKLLLILFFYDMRAPAILYDERVFFVRMPTLNCRLKNCQNVYHVGTLAGREMNFAEF